MGVALWDGGVIPKLDYYDTDARQSIASPLCMNLCMLGTYAIDGCRLPQNAKAKSCEYIHSFHEVDVLADPEC